MTKDTAIKLINEKHIHTQWDDDKEKWYFSIVDIVAVLIECENRVVHHPHQLLCEPIDTNSAIPFRPYCHL